MFHFSLQLLFKTLFTILGIYTKTHVGLHVQLVLHDFNQNCNLMTDFSKFSK